MTNSQYNEIKRILKEINSKHLGGFKNGWLDIEEEDLNKNASRIRLYTNTDEGKKRILSVTLPKKEINRS